MEKDKKRNKVLKDTTSQQREDIRANILLLSSWREAVNEGNHRFLLGLENSQFAIHIRPGTKAYSALQAVIEAELDQAGMDLIGLDLGGGNKSKLNIKK